MVKTKLRYYTYKVTFKDLPCYFYYGKHKDSGKPYLGSPKTWRHLWDQFEPEIQILQWYETSEEVEKVEKTLIRSTWKQTWNGSRYSLNENVGGFLSDEVRSEGGKKGGLSAKDKKSGWHGMSHQERVQTGSLGGKKSFDLKLGIHGLSEEERLKNCASGGKVGGKTTGSDNVRLSRGFCSPESRAKKKKPVLCLETGVIYESTVAASNATKVSSGNINSCCRGERETAGGFHWKRVIPDG